MKWKKESWLDLVILIIFALFVLSYFKLDLMLSETITTGGDTASHYYPMKYMADYLLPNLKLVGWSQGWYAGMPMFGFYFPLSFMGGALLSYIIGLPVAFKLVTLFAVLIFPFAAYAAMRKFGYNFPAPILAALMTMPFLFMEANSMWGGNIPSMLAGEFSYNISLAFVLVFLALLYKIIETNKQDKKENNKSYNKKWVFCGVLFAMIALTHAITTMFVAFASLFFLVFVKSKTEFIENFKIMLQIFLLGFMLAAPWFLPLLSNLGYTTSYADTWNVGIEQIFPMSIAAFFPLSAIGIFLAIKNKDRRIMFMLFCIAIAGILFFAAETLSVVNIRFAPFMQLLLLMLAGYGIYEIIRRIKPAWILTLIVIFIVLFYVNSNITFIDDWVNWNYSGFEAKGIWQDFKATNDFLAGGVGWPRVVYEHSSLHNSGGTPRIFESLPLFSGRNTLEGLYMQSSPSSPFIFYIQAEVSKEHSCPFWRQWECTQFNIEKGTEHLKMFNVKHFIARTDMVKETLNNHTEYMLLKEFGSFSVYELTTNKNQYVIMPEYYPNAKTRDNWKNESYEWFKNGNLSVPIIFDNELANKETGKKGETTPTNCSISETITEEKVSFHTSCVGEPHIIRISYHPSWQVHGADKIYLVSPSFMLVFPNNENVTLVFSSSLADYTGILLFIAGLSFIIYLFFIDKKITFFCYSKIKMLKNRNRQ